MECVSCEVLVGCNRVVGALSWGHDLVALGASNAVVLYEPTTAKVVGVLNGHTGEVNCVKWVLDAYETRTQHQILLSGGGDCSIRVWCVPQDVPDCGPRGHVIAVLKEHKTGITDIDFLHSSGVLLVVSISADEHILVWEAQDAKNPVQDKWRLQQKVYVGLKVPHCVALTIVPHEPDWILLALGGTDSCIHLHLSHGMGTFYYGCKLIGHQGWIRDLQFHQVKGGQLKEERLLLASAAGDRCVRVWSIQRTSTSDQGLACLSRLAPSSLLSLGGQSFSATLESLLVGHEDWVHSVHWRPNQQKSNDKEQPLQLLTASMDRTMIIWEFDDDYSGLWMNKESVGDAGSSALGYFGGTFSPDGQCILSHGFTGALHLWRREKNQEGDLWVPTPALVGHYGDVVGLTWMADGRCLMTVSTDQTARIITKMDGRWCEIARPQVHGHDFFGVANVPTQDGSFVFASCSEEKVIRVFTSTRAFHEALAHACGLAPPSSTGKQALGARVKALGLTNLSIFDEGTEEERNSMQDTQLQSGSEYTDGPEFAPAPSPVVVQGAPLEEHLCQNTLWPESHKLYGHGDCVYCVACDPVGGFLASACKSQSSSVATIWIWDARTWTSVDQLEGHTLTVTQMEFSRDGMYLLSGSRDRSFCIFERFEENGTHFKFLHRRLKAHTRIIWGVAWSSAGNHFATGSRDQSVKIWEFQPKESHAQLVHTISLESSITSLAFAPLTNPAEHVLAVGTEAGSIALWHLCIRDSLQLEQAWFSPEHLRHGNAVSQIKWQENRNGSMLTLATCSKDHSVRVYEMSCSF